MDIYNSRYFLINRKLMEVVGFWPYQNPTQKIVIRIIILTMLNFGLVPQIIGMYIEFGNLDKFLEHVAVLFYMLIIQLKVITMYMNEKKMKIVYESIMKNWLKIKIKQEKDILCEYSERGRLMTIIYVGYMLSASLSFVSLPIIPILKAFVFSLNETRERINILNGEYLIDRSNHYKKIYLFEGLVTASTVMGFSSYDAVYLVIVEHSLGIFAIVKYRLQLLVDFSTNQRLFGVKKKTDAYAWVVDTIRLHKDVVEFADVLENTYSSSFLIVICANSGAMVFTSILILIRLGDFMEMQRHGMVLFGLTMHLFFMSLPGQRLTDHSSGIYQDAYTNEWYAGTEKVKALLKFMIMRSTKPCELTCGGLYALNFSSFAMVLKSTASYFTVFSSFR